MHNYGVNKLPKRRFSRFWLKAILATLFLGLLTPQASSSASFFSNTIDKNPPFSKNLSVYLLDLSGSVDAKVVIAGFESLQNSVANVYVGGNSGDKIEAAASYFQWIPIRGAEANSSSLPLFTEEDDATLWASVRAIRGKSNQMNVLKKLRERNGLWSQLMNYRGLDARNCTTVAYKALANPGLSGSKFQNLNQNVCSVALKVRSRFSMVQANIIAFAGDKPTKKTNGTDLFGTIRKLEDVARNSSALSRYKEVRLVFVSDMVHKTAAIDLKTKLIGASNSAACALSKKISSTRGFKSSLFKVTIYGLGEMSDKKPGSSATSEKLYSPLRKFWDCFWVNKGLKLPDSEFKTLSSFGQNG